MGLKPLSSTESGFTPTITNWNYKLNEAQLPPSNPILLVKECLKKKTTFCKQSIEIKKEHKIQILQIENTERKF